MISSKINRNGIFESSEHYEVDYLDISESNPVPVCLSYKMLLSNLNLSWDNIKYLVVI